MNPGRHWAVLLDRPTSIIIFYTHSMLTRATSALGDVLKATNLTAEETWTAAGDREWWRAQRSIAFWWWFALINGQQLFRVDSLTSRVYRLAHSHLVNHSWMSSLGQCYATLRDSIPSIPQVVRYLLTYWLIFTYLVIRNERLSDRSFRSLL